MRKSLLIVLLVLGAASAALAHSYKQGDIEIGHIWARATTPKQTTAAVYLPLLNSGTQPDKLTGATSPLADKIQIHQDMNANNMAHMQKLDSIALEPGKPVALQPGGIHLMLFGVKKQINKGDTFPLTLQFEKAGAATVDVHVAAIGATSDE